MDTPTNNLQTILQTLDSLQSRVEELTTDSGATESVPQAPAAPGTGESGAVEHGSATSPQHGGHCELDPDAVSQLRDGVAELATMADFKAFPKFFVRLASQTGLRMLLLKKWTTGLQVFLEENIRIAPEARKKRSDGRAPIPTTKSDIFEATATEAAVYAGPVPVKNFPLDLTLMLGRGSRDRQIVVMPLPSQGHWNTFVYLDADQATEKSLVVAEILARFALVRMQLLGKGVRARQGRVAGILKTERHRRQKSQATRDERGSRAPVVTDDDSDPAREVFGAGGFAQTPPLSPADGPEIDPFVVHQPEPPHVAPDSKRSDRTLRKLKLAPKESGAPAGPRSHHNSDGPATAEDMPETPAWDGEGVGPGRLTPETILHHSGELPALPKAACHIMAVIEDPRTTATRLESALAMDQALTAKVLRIANSPFYGAVREIKTVSEAIVRLGFIAIRNWTLVTAARSVFLAPGAGMLYQKIWRQSVMSAMAGQLVAQVVGRADPESVFIGGLMQNIGQLVLARSHPELFQEILTESAASGRPYHEVEKQVLGFDHGALGSLLIREWNLSQELEDAVRWHHDFAAADARNAQVAAMISLGEEIALTSSGGDADAVAEELETAEPSAAAIFLGVNAMRIEELKRRARELQIDPHFFS